MASSAPAVAAPTTTRAVVIRAKGEIIIDEEVPTPKLRDGYVLVKTAAVALNPTDWKHGDFLMGGNPTGARVGCDYAGVVVAVDANVKQNYKPGDRIAGGVHGANQSQKEDGAFAEYIVAKPDIAFKIPDSWSDTDAATLGLGTTTVGQGLYQALKLNLPNDPIKTPEPVLIYGGATASGQLGIQFAKLSGYRVLTTASPKHTEYLKSLGADEVFDYHDAEAAVSAIKAAVAGGPPLRYAWDTVATKETAELCAKALAVAPADAAGTQGPGSLHYRSLLPIGDDVLQGVDSRIDNGFTLYYTAFGEAFEKYAPFPPKPDDLEFARSFWVIVQGLVDSGKLKPVRAFVNRGGSGLEGVLVGLQELKADKVSGGKLVYTISKDAKTEGTATAATPANGTSSGAGQQSGGQAQGKKKNRLCGSCCVM